MSSEASLFGPGSMMWRISREAVMLLGGRAAVLMQIAHPLVAAGVAAHSDYRSDPYARLRRTLDAMWTIVFESEADAHEVAARVGHVHSFVRGVAADGRTYSADDPMLKLWVHSTLVYSSVKVYERFIAPLSPEESARYYDETKVIAGLFGVPAAVLPGSYEDLKAWMYLQMETGEVEVGDTARDLAEPILRPLRVVPKRMSRASVITASLLPRPIREGYGLKLDAPRAAAFAFGSRASRMLLPRLPRSVRSHPMAREAERRIA